MMAENNKHITHTHAQARTQSRTRTVNLRALRPLSKNNNRKALFNCCLCAFFSHSFYFAMAQQQLVATKAARKLKPKLSAKADK